MKRDKIERIHNYVTSQYVIEKHNECTKYIGDNRKENSDITSGCKDFIISYWEYVKYLHQKNKLTNEDVTILKEPRYKADSYIQSNPEMKKFEGTFYDLRNFKL
jgi:hypothetical protein